MNTQSHTHRLQAGEALSVEGSGQAILVQGEVLLQRPARLLAGMVVLPASTRLSAPAQWDLGDGSAVVAVHRATVVTQRAESLLASLGSLIARAISAQRLPSRQEAARGA